MKKPEVKVCEKCGKPFTRRSHISNAQFRKMRFCSQECSGRYSRHPREPTPCECGAAVEVTVWVRQINANGITYAAPMGVCRACAAEIDNPLPGPEPAGTVPVFGWGTRRRKQDADAWFLW
jgi:hypothetical protein